MADKNKSHDFSCDNCGRKITADPPDDVYTQFFVDSCCEESLERFHECDNCDHRNKRYWCFFHIVVVSSSF